MSAPVLRGLLPEASKLLNRAILLKQGGHLRSRSEAELSALAHKTARDNGDIDEDSLNELRRLVLEASTESQRAESAAAASAAGAGAAGSAESKQALPGQQQAQQQAQATQAQRLQQVAAAKRYASRKEQLADYQKHDREALETSGSDKCIVC